METTVKERTRAWRNCEEEGLRESGDESDDGAQLQEHQQYVWRRD